MSDLRIGTLTSLAFIACLAAPSQSRGEDGIPWTGHLQAGALASTRTNSFVSAVPGGRFVVTVAHLAPSPDDATGRGVPATCESVRFRIDTLNVKRADGTVEVELGADQSIAAGQAVQVVRDIDPSSGAGMPTSELDLVGFRMKAEQASPRCGVVASASFYPDAASRTPIPVALIPDLGPSPRLSSGGGR